MEELLAVLKSSREKINQERRFLAALQGVDLSEEEKEDVSTFKDFKAGFGIGMGLGYESEGE